MSDLQEAETPLVSAVICTRNRPEKIGQAVASVLSNEHPNFELLVIDQSTDDQTREAVASYASSDQRVRYERMAAAGLSRAYNAGIRGTKGEVLAFTDDDCVVPSDWLNRIVEAFQRDVEADLLYGQVLPLEAGETGARLTPYLPMAVPARLSRKDGFRVVGMGANFAARRRLFDRIGGFDEVLGGGGPLKSSQDFDLAYRAYQGGAAIILRPEVQIRHDGRREAEDWPTLLLNYGIGDGAFYTKHVRCRDPYALWLLIRRLGLVGSRNLAKFALRRYRLPERPYFRGLLAGIWGSRRFKVDRSTRLYGAPR